MDGFIYNKQRVYSEEKQLIKFIYNDDEFL